MAVQYNPSYHVNGYNERNANDSVFYTIANVASDAVVTAADWQNVVYYVNTERNRRASSPYMQDYDFGTSSTVDATDFNNMINSLWGATYVYNMVDVVAANTSMNITAAKLNEIIQKVKDAGTICLCNCNYCTCNCNYCTCNCNYACTCNCNYSDRRLKRNIKLVGNIDGINVYSFSYMWDDKVYVGAMAQDLIGTEYESALSKDARGYYVVDYTKLPFTMQEVK